MAVRWNCSVWSSCDLLSGPEICYANRTSDEEGSTSRTHCVFASKTRETLARGVVPNAQVEGSLLSLTGHFVPGHYRFPEPDGHRPKPGPPARHHRPTPEPNSAGGFGCHL